MRRIFSQKIVPKETKRTGNRNCANFFLAPIFLAENLNDRDILSFIACLNFFETSN